MVDWSRLRSKDDLTLIEVIGQGTFGTVMLGTMVGGNQDAFAVKMIETTYINNDNKVRRCVRNEIEIMYKIQHPRIIKLYCDFQDDDFVYLAMELAPNGTLFNKLTSMPNQRFTNQLTARYFAETCEALVYIHDLKPEKVVHRDIKPENILLDMQDHIKLGDFGCANAFGKNPRTTFVGTCDYIAPEILKGIEQDSQVDMWSMGVLAYEMSSGKAPFTSTSILATCGNILECRYTFPDGLDNTAKDLIDRLCRKKSKERLTAKSAMKHVFVTRHLGKAATAGGRSNCINEGSPDCQTFIEENDPAQETHMPTVEVARHMRQIQEKEADLQRILESKKEAEQTLLLLCQELERIDVQARDEKTNREQVEADNAAISVANKKRDEALQKLRKECKHLEVQAARLRNQPRWMMFRRDVHRAPHAMGVAPSQHLHQDMLVR